MKQTEESTVPQTYIELDPQTRDYESPYQQPLPKNPNTPDAYMDLDPRSQEGVSSYQELHTNTTSKGHDVQRQVYAEIVDTKSQEQVYQDIGETSNKYQSQEYVNVH